MPSIISLSQIANQEFQVILEDQLCTIHLYQRGGHMYMDLSVEDDVIFQGALCVHCADVGQYERAGFKGMFVFIDTLGQSAPTYDGLGDRYVLYYYTEDEIEALDDEVLKIVR